MTNCIDLHTHSTASDGSLSPRELMIHAKKAGLAAIALTDHDTVAGLEEASLAAKEVGIELVKGIEFSVASSTETHILGLLIDPEAPALKDAMARSQKQRIERAYKTAEKLRALGFSVTFEEAAATAGGDVIGRAHFARVLVDKGYIGSVKEAFDSYLASGKPAYVGGHVLTDRDAIDIIHSSGGVAVLAHPHLIRLSDSDLFVYMQKLKAYGLDGVEGYYTEFTPEMEMTFRSFAAKLSLALSGGSDFHGKNKPTIAIGKGYGNLDISYSLLTILKSLRK